MTACEKRKIESSSSDEVWHCSLAIVGFPCHSHAVCQMHVTIVMTSLHVFMEGGSIDKIDGCLA